MQSSDDNKPRPPLVNNNWYAFNKSDTLYVFVHGFFSNSNHCWTSANGVCWPQLILEDERLGNPSIYMSGFSTTVDSGEYRIADCAREVFEGLRCGDLNGLPPPILKNNVVFICHSLGGIVTRYMLERYRESFSDKSIALILIASPSYGAALAGKLSGIAKLYKNRLADQLTFANESLEDLDGRFKDLLQRRVIKKLVGAEAIEHHFPFHWKFIPGVRPIVEKSSAARYFGPSKLLYGTDHSSCAKPTDHHHVSHKFLVATISEIFPELISKIDPTNFAAETDNRKKYNNPGVLFNAYSVADEAFYIARNIDRDLNNALKTNSLWVYGDSGLGKTASVSRLVEMQKLQAVHVYVGASVDIAAGYIELLKEIYYSLVTKIGCECKEFNSHSQLISEIVTLLHNQKKSDPLVLVIDEVEVQEKISEEIGKFVVALHKIITCYTQKYPGQGIRIIVTSIASPELYLPSQSGKFYEYWQFQKFSNWISTDLNSLISLIDGNLEARPILATEKESLLTCARGSPRFIKNFYKKYISSPHQNEEAFSSAIRETAVELGFN